jgi:hypothetical protein
MLGRKMREITGLPTRFFLSFFAGSEKIEIF